MKVLLIALALGAAAFAQDAWAACEGVAEALPGGWVVEGAAAPTTEAEHRFAATMFYSHPLIVPALAESLPTEHSEALGGLLIPFHDGQDWQVFVQDSLGTGLPVLACLLRLEGS